jgi:hypothetical protein
MGGLVALPFEGGRPLDGSQPLKPEWLSPFDSGPLTALGKGQKPECASGEARGGGRIGGENNYSYYQYYSNAFVAIILSLLCYLTYGDGTLKSWVVWFLVSVVALILLVACRNELNVFNRRAEDITNQSESERNERLTELQRVEEIVEEEEESEEEESEEEGNEVEGERDNGTAKNTTRGRKKWAWRKRIIGESPMNGWPSINRDEARRLVEEVLGLKNIADAAPLSALGYTSSADLYALLYSINRVIDERYGDSDAITNFTAESWHTVGDVVTSVQQARRPATGKRTLKKSAKKRVIRKKVRAARTAKKGTRRRKK